VNILIVAEGHPAVAPGDAETAAFRLFGELARRDDCRAHFLGARRGGDARRARIGQPFGGREFLYAAPATDAFSLKNRDPEFPAAFAELLRALQPDVVHFHGLDNLGIEAPAIARRAVPAARLVLSLHDFSPICAHHGQMRTRPHRAPCAVANPAACARCFPEHEPADFLLRATYARLFLDPVDRFVVPNQFVGSRYAAWGIASARIAVLPSVGAAAEILPPRAADGTLRVGVFSALSPLDGLAAIIEAARALEKRAAIAFILHGSTDALPNDLAAESRELLAHAPRTVSLRGHYHPDDIATLMAEVDLVAAPSLGGASGASIVEDALALGRPVIAAAQGGLAERVRDGTDGFLIPPGDGAALARLLERLAALPHKLSEMAAGMRAPPTPAESASRHLALYAQLRDPA
jgi:glycosyltransferase involved in cell wall biosynthesis